MEEEAPQTAGDEGKKGGWIKKEERATGKGGAKKRGGESDYEETEAKKKKSRDRLKNNASDIRRGESEDKHFFFLPFCH